MQEVMRKEVGERLPALKTEGTYNRRNLQEMTRKVDSALREIATKIYIQHTNLLIYAGGVVIVTGIIDISQGKIKKEKVWKH